MIDSEIKLEIVARDHMEAEMTSGQLQFDHDQIAQRAYEIWQARGCPPGDGSDNWRAAEQELMSARVARDQSTQRRVQSWWQRVREKIALLG